MRRSLVALAMGSMALSCKSPAGAHSQVQEAVPGTDDGGFGKDALTVDQLDVVEGDLVASADTGTDAAENGSAGLTDGAPAGFSRSNTELATGRTGSVIFTQDFINQLKKQKPVLEPGHVVGSTTVPPYFYWSGIKGHWYWSGCAVTLTQSVDDFTYPNINYPYKFKVQNKPTTNSSGYSVLVALPFQVGDKQWRIICSKSENSGRVAQLSELQAVFGEIATFQFTDFAD